MKKRGKYLFIGLLLLFIFQISSISADVLKVTTEHPFLINGKWIPASQLKVGDVLTTLDGKTAIIKNINSVNLLDPFKVYNLEAGIFHDFIVGKNKIIVHNSDSLVKFAGVPELSPSELNEFYDEKQTLDRLVECGTQGIIKNTEGFYKTVYIIDPNTIDINLLPKNVKALAIKKQGGFVLKYLNEGMDFLMDTGNGNGQERRAYDLMNEIEYMQLINSFGDEIFPNKISFGVGFTTNTNGLVNLRGLIIEEQIMGTSAFKFSEDIENSVRQNNFRAILLARKYNGAIYNFFENLDNIFENEGIRVEDMHSENVAVEFRDNQNKLLTLNDILCGNQPMSDITINFKAYELGGAKEVTDGSGGIVTPGGVSLYTYLENQFLIPTP